MQLRHLKTVIPASDAPNRVSAIAWSPNNQKLAVVGADRVVQLFDETGERKDRFSTKPADPQKTSKPYTICGLAFSSDSTKLAIAQTDCVVFVYKLGLEWGEKKSICNKLIQSSEITSMTWPKEQPNALVFGLADGKVRVGNLKTNKAATLYQTESCVVSTASNLEGNAIISGHADGSVNRFFFDDAVQGAAQGKFVTHRCAPDALAWGESIVAAGCDKVVVFYDQNGKVVQQFDYSNDENVYDFTTAEFNPSGQSVVLGSFNRFHIYNYSVSSQQWSEAAIKIIDNFYTVTALAWKPDGSRLAAANMCGATEIFDCCLKRSRYKGKFEFTYVSPSQVIVKRLSTGSRIVLKSHYGYEITKVNIFQDQFLIANTNQTLLMGDLASCKLSEISWIGSGNEKFYFENPRACMVFNAGELSLVEYGVNEILGSCRTEHMNPHSISVRINDRKFQENVKKVAYLIDLQTINVLDLITGFTVGSVSHDSKIDWLELSGKGTNLLFRDKRNQLHLYDVAAQTRVTLLSYCTYVQWVPNSDVIVAQSRNNLCIWYSVAFPKRVTMFPIKGDIEDIERVDGKTEVIVDEGVNTVSYTLDESLIEFGTSLEDRDYERAVALLETLTLNSDTEAMWKTLSQMALKDDKLKMAERCFAALGDVATTQYLRNLNDVAEKINDEGIHDGIQHYAVKAKLAMLDKQFKIAENIYLEQGKVEDAMNMYQEMHKWNLSIKVAEMKNHPELETLKKNYYSWLIDSGQEDQAAETKEEEGDYTAAIHLYLKAGMPGRASQVLLQRGLTSNSELTERIAASLYKSSLYEKAGELYEKLGSNDRALDSYKKGKSFRAAIELARHVIVLEEQWGNYLVSVSQMDAAINHYIEAGKTHKAIEAAISAKQWRRAVGIIETLESPYSNKTHLLQIAKYFDENSDFSLAERYYVLAGRPQEAVDMYTKANKWEKAHTLATTYMTQDEVSFLYVSHARDMEAQGKMKEAEKLFLTVGEPDLAINMYKNHKQYDAMIRLVTAHHKDLLGETHLYLARTLEGEGNLRLSEHHYVEGKDWKSAINMYCANNMHEEAYRVAKTYGGVTSSKQVAYLWARSLGGESAVKLLTKFNLLDAAIDFATENGAFDFAFELTKFSEKGKLAEVHYKHAMFLEDEGKFKEAEAAFIIAGKPKEAILMYVHNENWESALAVAEAHDPANVAEVLIGQAKVSFEKKEYAKAESLLLRAQRPDVAINLYKGVRLWNEAIKFAKEYLPNKLAEIHEEREKYSLSQSNNGKDEILNAAKNLEKQKDYSRAIDMYLRLSPKMVDDLTLEQHWVHCVELASKFCGPERTRETILAVCTRLVEINKHESAAQVFVNAGGMYKEAIDCCIAASLWDKARQIGTLAPKYNDYIEHAYMTELKRSGHAEKLVNVDIAAGLDMLVQRGDWGKCLEKAATEGSDALNKYLLICCSNLIKESKYEQAVKYVVKHGVPANPNAFDTYIRITREVLHNGSNDGMALLREMLFKLVHGSTLLSQQGIPPNFNVYLMIAHLNTLKNYCSKKKELLYFGAKQSISLLRYIKDIPADKAFFEAGSAAKAAGMNNMAFVCWNRYLDMSEAIEEGDSSLLENADFEKTDVPYDVDLPPNNLPEAKREEVRDWILQVSLDQKINQELDHRDCEDCGTSIYDASLTCYNCSSKSEACVVTGYPVLRNKVKCTGCNRNANKEDWNKFVMIEKVCPWCGTTQIPVYSIAK
ncbi:hypothetical protein HDU92_005616 [Lobulomyces angularis]|nr:hypothetical protein HDU92_005616 [Lobulomyces angularis]